MRRGLAPLVLLSIWVPATAAADPPSSFQVRQVGQRAGTITVEVVFGRPYGSRHARVDLELQSWLPAGASRLNQESRSLQTVASPQVGDVLRLELPWRQWGIEPRSRGVVLGTWKKPDGAVIHSWGGETASARPSGTIHFDPSGAAARRRAGTGAARGRRR